jgi:general secretion pathway protein H
LGFTLLELLVVVMVIAIGTAGVAIAMRDGHVATIEREALRLAVLLDGARAQSVATGHPVTWSISTNNTLLWQGLRSKEPMPTQWLDRQTQAIAATPVVLGPEPVIAPTRIRLVLGTDRRDVVTDGVGNFGVSIP